MDRLELGVTGPNACQVIQKCFIRVMSINITQAQSAHSIMLFILKMNTVTEKIKNAKHRNKKMHFTLILVLLTVVPGQGRRQRSFPAKVI